MTPPPIVGEIYTVIEYKRIGTAVHPWERGASNSSTSVAVAWGTWQHHWVVSPATGTRGFVLKLRHTGADSVPLLVGTDGNVTSVPAQQRPPSEWTDPSYQRVQW